MQSANTVNGGFSYGLGSEIYGILAYMFQKGKTSQCFAFLEAVKTQNINGYHSQFFFFFFLPK